MTKILKIEYSPYKLSAKQAPNSKTKQTVREGVLLRFTFKEYGQGYADCHPLTEFGDLPLKKQLAYLTDKKFTNITQRSLYFATIDAQSRMQRMSAFEDIKNSFPCNHFTSPALIKKEDILLHKKSGFTHFKFKFGNHEPNEINYVQNMAQLFRDHNLKMRLDFNGNLNRAKTLEEFVPYADVIDFIEDPFQEINDKTVKALMPYSNSLQFACDFVQTDDPEFNKIFTYKIIKPARENIIKLGTLNTQKIVFTSSMDHPLGQVCALYESCMHNSANTVQPFGLLTHHLFESNPYSDMLKMRKTALQPPIGLGFGFDMLLKKETWRKCFG